MGKQYRKFKFKQKLPMQSNIQMTAYELNKLAYAKLPTIQIGSKEWHDALDTLVHYTVTLPSNKYFMLLNNELHYYTVFHIVPKTFYDLSLSFSDCIRAVGELITIEHNEATNALECWIKKDNEAYMFPFFPYDEGVIECHQ